MLRGRCRSWPASVHLRKHLVTSKLLLLRLLPECSGKIDLLGRDGRGHAQLMGIDIRKGGHLPEATTATLRDQRVINRKAVRIGCHNKNIPGGLMLEIF